MNKNFLFVIFAVTMFFCGNFTVKADEDKLLALTTEEMNAAFDKQVAADKAALNNPGSTAVNGVLPNDTRLHSYPITTTQQAPVAVQAQPKKFSYTLLESLPGFFNAGTTLTDLPSLILAIYKFGIWTVGIAGLFMLVIGGFMYMTSAGNNSSAGNAKDIIWDALIGIIAALGAYLILYVINPDLTKINLSFTAVNITETEGTPMGPSGVCKELTSGDCSTVNLTSTFGAKASQASSICNGESEGKPIASTVDKCADGSVASWGLFQINITVHSIGGYDCPKAFAGGAYTAKNHSCRVIDQQLYNNCVNAAKVASNNIAAAKSVFSSAGGSWKPWGANKRSGCNFP